MRAKQIKCSIATLTLLVGALAPAVSGATLIGLLEQTAPVPTNYIEFTDFKTFADNAEAAVGDVTASLQAVDIGTTSGCEAADFGGFTAGNIALMERGVCLFSTKVNNAAAAGAVGALIFDVGTSFLGGLLVDPTTIPALFLTNTLGESLVAQLAQAGSVTIHMSVIRVPEPATLALLGIALAGLGFSRRKRATN